MDRCPTAENHEHCWHVPAEDPQMVICCWCREERSGFLLARSSDSKVINRPAGSVLPFRRLNS
jgi:hypothetical protein